MTTTTERLTFLQDYREWRENQEILGKPSGLDAYEEVLIADEPLEQLAEIQELAIKLGRERGPAASIFASEVQEILGITNKEVVPA